jgi:simple sugar transport system permease protein
MIRRTAFRRPDPGGPAGADRLGGQLGSVDRAARALLAPARSGNAPLAVAVVTVVTVGTVVAALGITAGLVAIVGGPPGEVFSSMLVGSVGSASAVSQTLLAATPLLLVAVGSCVSSRVGVFNIGQEGQLLLGAAVGAYVGLRTQGPPAVVLTLTLLCSAVGGAVWAAIPAVMRYRRGVDVVVSTLLMIFIAEQLVSFVISRPSLLQETRVPGQIVAPQSNALAPAFRLPTLGSYPGLTVSVGAFVAFALAVATAVLPPALLALRRSAAGRRRGAAAADSASAVPSGAGA